MSLLKKPNERELLLKQKTKGVDDLVDRLLENPEDDVFVHAQKLRSSSIMRNYVEACLVTGRSFGDIGEVLEIPAEVIELYAKIFYDIEDLNKLELLGIIDSEPKEFQTMKHWALSQGLEFIAWRLGKYGEVNAIEGLNSLFNDCFYKSKEAFFNSNSTTSSKESLKWMKMSMDIARLLRSWTTSSADDSKEEIIFALQEVVPEFEKIENLDLAEEPVANLPTETEEPDSGD